MSNSSGGITSLVGRALFAPLLFMSAYFKITAYSSLVGHATLKGLPMANIGVAIAAALELLGGIAILIGFQVRIVAWVLFLYVIPTTFIFHNF